MKKLMTLGLLATTCVFADAGEDTAEVASMMKKQEAAQSAEEPVKASYGYFNIGLGPFPIPMPLFSFGGRFQNNHNGFDGSLQFISFGSGFTLLKENFDYLYYFKPNLKSQFYLGAGVAFTEVLSHRHVAVLGSPQFVVGKQYTNEAGDVRFFQAQIDPVFVSLKHNRGKWGTFPCVILSYGICF